MFSPALPLYLRDVRLSHRSKVVLTISIALEFGVSGEETLRSHGEALH
jgi:hypothetical protein